MATLIISDIDEQVLERARAEAEAQGGTLEAQLRSQIEERVRASELERQRRAEQAIASMREYRERIFAKYGQLQDSTELLRQERQEW